MPVGKYCLAVAIALLTAVACEEGYKRPQEESPAPPATGAPPTAEAPAPAPSPRTSPPPATTETKIPETQKSRETPAPAPRPEPPRTADLPKPAPAPRIVQVTLPQGTLLELELLTGLDSAVSRAGDEIQARTLSPVYMKGESVIAKGSYLEGRVTEAKASGRVKGRASLGFTFDRLSTKAGPVKIRTSYVGKEAGSGKKKDAKLIGGGAGVGAVVGGIIGGKKGAAIGAAVGGGAGTGVVLATKGEDIKLPAGTEVNVRLDDAVTVVVR